MLVVENLNKHYGRVQAVKDVSFQVEKGKTFAFLGTNGAGKSTVIYMLMDLIEKDSGKIQFAKDEVIGTVFQSHRLDEELTIEENIYLRAKLYGMKKTDIQKRMDELFHFMSLSHARHRKYGICSGGEKRKADIIRALIHRPSFLILDEPTTWLDAESREDIWIFLRQLQEEQDLTIFLTTHYIEEAEDADYVLIMDKGEVKVEGTPSDLRATYSKMKLILHVNNKDEVIEQLNQQKYIFETNGNNLFIPLESSVEAIPILHSLELMLIDFTMKKSSLEHVFLQITKEKSE